MSAISQVGGGYTQDMMRAQQQVAASRSDASREAGNVAQLRTNATEEAMESGAEQASEVGAEGTAPSLNILA
jgi:hypothetical protein